MTNEEFIQSIALPGEEWRDVVGWERYAVSSFGRIAAYSSPYKCGSRICRRKPQILNPVKTNNKPTYRVVRLSNGRGERALFLVHRLVAGAFIPNPNNYPCVDHIDDNPQNNNKSNLQWCDYKTNNSKPRHRLLSSRAKLGRVDPKRKPLVILKDGLFVRRYDSMHAALLDGHMGSAILRVLRGQLKTHHGFQWMYLSDYESQVSMSKNSI